VDKDFSNTIDLYSYGVQGLAIFIKFISVLVLIALVFGVLGGFAAVFILILSY